MTKIFETTFDILYLITVVTLGIKMIWNAGNVKQYRLFGYMAVVLGAGDAFHLVPRIYAMWTTGMEANASMLGFGQFITSITMTIFYIMLYHIWRINYKISGQKKLTFFIYLLAVLRIALCFAPQNQWFSLNSPLIWSIYRNIPFAVMGCIILILYYQQSKKSKDKEFRFMWLAIILSFAFYIPVVLFSNIFPPIGMLMIPKTCAYVWIVWMGFRQKKDPVGI
ncbi:MAG: hypothetical protein VB095_01425 [Anaerovorax sp.]|nr:hypothetical protein [Anaerovorax sp.]